MAGVAADASLGLRAAAFADVGDVFGNRMALERIVLMVATGMLCL